MTFVTSQEPMNLEDAIQIAADAERRAEYHRSEAEAAEQECQRLARRLAQSVHQGANLQHRIMMMQRRTSPHRSRRAISVVVVAFVSGPILWLAYHLGWIGAVGALSAAAIADILGFLYWPDALGVAGKDVDHG